MARSNQRAFALSAQYVDPLSWFTGPFVPLTTVGLVALWGGPMVVLTWEMTRMPWLQLIALVACVASPVFVHIATRRQRRPIGARGGATALAISIVGVVVSAIGYAGSDFSIVVWWAPISFALAIIALGPYLAGRTLATVGGVSTIVMASAALAIISPAPAGWGPVGAWVIIATPAALALASMITFSYVVVSRMLTQLESSSGLRVTGGALRDEAAEQIERVTLARLTARAVPFIESLAESGEVTPESRALAGQIARRLRDDLVTQSAVTWLDSIAEQSRLVVVDPDRLATRMTRPQRRALQALLAAVIETPGTDSDSLMIELRGAPDGATAVAVSFDMALPEGRRILHMAPHYLTLTTSVEDLEVSRNAFSFRFGSRDLD